MPVLRSRFNLRLWKGATPSDLISGRVDAYVGAIDAAVKAGLAIKSVQHISVSTTFGSPSPFVDVTISNVNTAKAWVIATMGSDAGTSGSTANIQYWRLTSSTTVRFFGTAAMVGVGVDLYFTVIEFQ